MFQFELELVPLRFYPMPEKYSADVVQLMTFVKVTKEFILLGLMVHEHNSLEALQFFDTDLMILVVTNMSLLSSEAALEGLQDLKAKCIFTPNGFRVSSNCWRLDKQIEEFYNAHPW
jgi:hypothetical protein